MDEDTTQDALSIKMVAEMLKAKALAEADDAEQQRRAIDPESGGIPTAGSVLSSNESPAVKEVTGDKTEVIEQVVGAISKSQQASTPGSVSVPSQQETSPPAASSFVAVLESRAASSATTSTLDINQQFQEAAEPNFDTLFEPEGQPDIGKAEQPLATNYEQQRVETPESILFSEAETERSQIAVQEADDVSQERREFLTKHAETIESLRSIPSELWSPEQRSQAEQIRQVKAAYRSRVQDLTQEPEQGPELPEPPPPPAFGSERTIETQDLFASQRLAAEAMTWGTPEGVHTGRRSASQEALQAAADAATPAEFVGSTPPPESPPQTALAAIPEEHRGNLSSDALSEATWFEQAGTATASTSGLPVHGPEETPIEAEVVPESIWTRMGRRARQALVPPAPGFAQSQSPLDPASFSEGTREHPRSVFDQSDEEGQEPLATGGAGYGNVGGRIFDSLTGGRSGSRGGTQGGSQGVMHVWIDGGQLQTVDHINTIGAVTGKTVPVSSPSPATGSQDDEEAGEFTGAPSGGRFGWQSLLSVGAFAGMARNAITSQAGFAGGQPVSQMASDAMSMGGTVVGGAAAGAQLGSVVPGVGTAVGAGVGAAVGASAAIATLPQKIVEWGEALVDSRKHLSLWSGQLQGFDLEKQWRQWQRDIKSAESTGASTAGLGRALQDLQDEWRPIRDEVYKAATIIVQGSARVIQFGAKLWEHTESLPKGLKELAEIIKILSWINDKINPPQEDKEVLQRWHDGWNDLQIPSSRVI